MNDVLEKIAALRLVPVVKIEKRTREAVATIAEKFEKSSEN